MLSRVHGTCVGDVSQPYPRRTRPPGEPGTRDGTQVAYPCNLGEKLRCFLDRNLPLHRAPVIESLRLKLISPRFKPKNINMWILTALPHCLRELEIVYEAYSATSNILPSNLYTCKSLVILKLDGEILLDVPRVVSLPSLKTLKLVSARYFNEETLLRLLSNCPILEELVVDLRENDTMGTLIVSVPSLQSLSLYIPRGYDIDGYVINTPSLKYFKLMDHSYESHDCLIENMPYLIEAYVDCFHPDINSLVGSITPVKRLAICLETMLDEGFVFNQLEHLEDHDNNPYGMEDWNQPSTVPDCMLSSLQSLKWMLYTGEPKREILWFIF
ncbi:hypothetical protein Bca4012_056823 [Brassica carinata]